MIVWADTRTSCATIVGAGNVKDLAFWAAESGFGPFTAKHYSNVNISFFGTTETIYIDIRSSVPTLVTGEGKDDGGGGGGA